MNPKDRKDIENVKEYLEEQFSIIENQFSTLNNNISKIERAIYGDPDNKVPGLIDLHKSTQDEMHVIEVKVQHGLDDIKKRVHTLEKLKSQIRWISAGIGVGASIAGSTALEWITKLK